MRNINELLAGVQEITASGLPFMEGREKLDVDNKILGEVLTVEEYGYMKGLNKDTGLEEEYVTIALQEYPLHFIYGSSVVTQAFKKIDDSFTLEEIAELLTHGLKFKLSKVVSANKRKYTKINFVA